MNTKEVLLARRRGWSKEVPCWQNIASADMVYQTTRLGVLLAEWERRLELTFPTNTRQQFVLYSRKVWAKSMWITRTGVDRKSGRDRWNLQPQHIPDTDTVRHRVLRLVERANERTGGALDKLKAGHLRHYAASFFKFGLMDRGDRTWDDPKDFMRHKTIGATKEYYLMTALHPGTQQGWSEQPATRQWPETMGGLFCI